MCKCSLQASKHSAIPSMKGSGVKEANWNGEGTRFAQQPGNVVDFFREQHNVFQKHGKSCASNVKPKNSQNASGLQGCKAAGFSTG